MFLFSVNRRRRFSCSGIHFAVWGTTSETTTHSTTHWTPWSKASCRSWTDCTFCIHTGYEQKQKHRQMKVYHIDSYCQIVLVAVALGKMLWFKITKGCQHLSKYGRGGGNLRDVKAHTQTWTPGLAQVSCFRHSLPKYAENLCFFLTMFLLSTSEVSQSHSLASTKILYFTGKSPTPSMINIPKRCVCVCPLF